MTYRSPVRMVALATVGLLVAGCASRPGAEQARGDVSGKQGRIIEVRMVDTAFEPAEFTVSGGETVTFRFTNAGKAVHEAFIGDVQDQAAHEEEMAARMEHGGHGDDAEDALTLEPGRSGELRTRSPSRTPSRSAAINPVTTRRG